MRPVKLRIIRKPRFAASFLLGAIWKSNYQCGKAMVVEATIIGRISKSAVSVQAPFNGCVKATCRRCFRIENVPFRCVLSLLGACGTRPCFIMQYIHCIFAFPSTNRWLVQDFFANSFTIPRLNYGLKSCDLGK